MSERRVSASEVMKSLEGEFTLASELMDEIARLYAEMAARQKQAKERAIRLLGHDQGERVYDLALDQFPNLKSGLINVAAPAAPSQDSPLPSQFVSPATAPQVAMAPAASVEFYGISIPVAQSDEAKAVAARVINHRSDGASTLLYSTDRGKNSWRKRLEQAIVASKNTLPVIPEAPAVHEAAIAPVEAVEPPSVQIIPSAVAVETLPMTATAQPIRPTAVTWEADPLDDLDDMDDLKDSHEFEAPAVMSEALAEAPPEAPSPAPPLESLPEVAVAPPPVRNEPPAPVRRASYGNASPKPEGLAAAIQSAQQNGRDPTVPAAAPIRRFSNPRFAQRDK
jgi:hypothetical protein